MQITKKFQNRRGYALMLTLLFVSVSLVLMVSVGRWAASSSLVTARNNTYNSAVAAAEGATEVIIAQMDRDFLHQSMSQSVGTYNSIMPATFVPSGWTKDYQFSDGYGNPNRTDVVCKNWQSWTNLDAEFKGLYGMMNSYQITSNARRITGPYSVAAAVRQNVNFTAIPIFQYAVFYSLDLEITPGPAMYITGKTHGNADLYVAPNDVLQFMDTVTVVGDVINGPNPNDPTDRSGFKKPLYKSDPKQVSPMTLPVGTNNDPANVVQILDVPPVGEDPHSEMGRQRFYNKSDLIITVGNNSVTVNYNNNEDGTSFAGVPTNRIGNGGFTFINTNITFFDYREKKQVIATEIDVAALTNWMGSAGFTFNTLSQAQNNHQINSVYIQDKRSVSGKLTAVRLANGRILPGDGLTVATAQPLYVKGNYNAPDLTVGLTNTLQTKPAALASDAITVLSGNWNDSWTSGTGLSSRTAVNTTVNAAFLSGIVQSTDKDGGHYSGGVENYPRFLENWSGTTLTYNGSMVVMFPSRFATSYWIAPGTYYNPPVRKWAFDTNFQDASKLPPNTPQVRKLQRGQWSIVAAK